MPAIDPGNGPAPAPEPLTRLPFKPVTREHIMHCSYDFWFEKYRCSSIKSRIIPLSPAFLSYLREDGIVLPSDEPTFPPPSTYTDHSTTDWDTDPDPDPSLAFPEIHRRIKDTIAELGGLVAPKLNWSSPKDATWISIKKNSMECSTPSDIYLLLKSSSFTTHDLEYPFADTLPSSILTPATIPYVLVLRKWFKVNPSCEFRCFVRQRTLIGICQRDLNHFKFLFPLKDKIRDSILGFFNNVLKNTFPESDFTFDIYIPEPYNHPRLMDINPWAPRTDPLLFSWLELLTLPMPAPLLGVPDSADVPRPASSSGDTQDSDNEDVAMFKPEFRLVLENDPEARNFSTPQYSAHKLPQEVVDASLEGETGMREFAEQWKRMMSGEVGLQGSDSDSDSSDADLENENKDILHESEILADRSAHDVQDLGDRRRT